MKKFFQSLADTQACPLQKIIFPTIILIFVFLPAVFGGNAYAFDITAGATTWYAWGRQYYTQKDNIDNYNADIKSDPAFLYGPALSVKFNDDFNLTFVYLYGKFSAEKNDGSKADFKRNDSDLALNYKLNDYFKVFIGAKYLSYDIIPVKDNFWGSMDFKVIGMESHTSYGPGLGVSATIPITGNIFGLATISGLYLWGEEKVDKTNALPYPYELRKTLKIGYNEYGINSNISMAYYIAQYSIVISLGGRFQFIMADYEDNEIHLSDIKFMIYGATLTATYTFRI